jgi:Na+-exporting ATPase
MWDDSTGLSTIDAEKRLEIHGSNKIDGSGQVSLWEVLLRQVSNSLTIVSSSFLCHLLKD